MKSTKSKGRSWRLYGLLSILLVFGLVLTAYTGTGQDLIDATENGNIATVNALLVGGADVNAKANDGRTALIQASLKKTYGETVQNPMIEFTFVPPYGSSLNLEGRVSNVEPNSFKVAVYIFVEGAGWWTKPTLAQPLTSIQPDSTWTVDITTGGSDIFATRIHAYLLPNGITPPLSGGLSCLPDTLNSIAVADVDTMRTPRLISFSGYEWWVKNSAGAVGPGPNIFSDSTENVWVDDNGDLHLKIAERDGNWYCSEVILRESLGYGRYVFQITGNIGQINENVVLGLFTWDNDACTENHKEIDIEFSRWGNAQDTTNAQYVIQPWNVSGNLQRWQMPITIDSSTHYFVWSNDTINFFSVKGHQSHQPYDSILSSWSYVGSDIPNPGAETVRLNLWLNNGIPPSNGQEAEVIITDFEYFPNNPVSIEEQNKSNVKGFYLLQNYPNPFNPSTTITFGLPQRVYVNLSIYNILGKKVNTLIDRIMSAGTHTVKFETQNLPAGIYFYHLLGEKVSLMKKMLLLR